MVKIGNEPGHYVTAAIAAEIDVFGRADRDLNKSTAV